MIRTLALLCAIAAPAFGLWEYNLKVRFGGLGNDYFMEVPMKKAKAIEQNWISKERQWSPDGLESLELLCPNNDNRLCLYFDNIGDVVGLQFALDTQKFTGKIYNWTVQGWKPWTTTNYKGETRTYWVTCQFFISKETLALSPEQRPKRTDKTGILYDGAVWVNSFNGELLRIPADVKELDTASDFTVQSCIPWMGTHYYYNMTKTMECKVDTILPYFPLTYADQIVGMGVLVDGKYTLEEGEKDWCEHPDRSAVAMIVKNGPDCYHALPDGPGVLTMHVYYVHTPRSILCLGSLGK